VEGRQPMSAYVLITGTLHRDPVMRTAKTGTPFATALLRAESQGETLWVNVVAFSEAAQAELLGIKTGEALSIQGSLKVSVYEKNGEHLASPDVVASHVLALRQPRREDGRGPRATAIQGERFPGRTSLRSPVRWRSR
jgi:single-stranded DNA-binding protein